jgi:hypothetical protein
MLCSMLLAFVFVGSYWVQHMVVVSGDQAAWQVAAFECSVIGQRTAQAVHPQDACRSVLIR